MPALLSEAQLLGVKVFISDNHSTDGTSDYLKTLSEQFSCLKYKTQKQNTGIDYNMISVMTMSDTPFIYPMGDDETLIPNALSKIINFLNLEGNEKTDLIMLNGWYTNISGQYLKQHLLPNSSFMVFNQIDAFAKLHDKMPFSSFIINSESLKTNYLKFIGTSHAYSGIPWEYFSKKIALQKNIEIKFILEPLVLFPQLEKTYKLDISEVMLHEIPLWYQTLPDEYQSAVANILKEYYQREFNVGKLIEYRLSDQLSNDLLDKIQTVVPELEYKRVHFIANMPLNFLMLIVNFINTLQYDVQKKGHYDPNSIGDILVGVLDNIILSSNTETGE